MSVRVSLIALLVAIPAVSAHAQHAGHDAAPAPADSGMPLYRAALGPFSREAGRRSREAQAYFDHGFQLI